MSATKPNDNVPKPHTDLGITLEITWQNNPAVDQIIVHIAAQPEDPAGRSPGSATREEPCGKEVYRGGVLTCRKVITPWIGAGEGSDLVMWRIGWTGKGQKGGLVGVGINNFGGSPATARAWIDAIIPGSRPPSSIERDPNSQIGHSPASAGWDEARISATERNRPERPEAGIVGHVAHVNTLKAGLGQRQRLAKADRLAFRYPTPVAAFGISPDRWMCGAGQDLQHPLVEVGKGWPAVIGLCRQLGDNALRVRG